MTRPADSLPAGAAPRDLRAFPAGPAPPDLRALLALALRASAGRSVHANAARQVVLAILFAQLMAGAGHDGPPHAALRAPRHAHPRRLRLRHRGSVAGRRPRG